MAGGSETRLIIIRGNSGSGKSSLATSIRVARPPRSVAIISQDTVRREIRHHHRAKHEGGWTVTMTPPTAPAPGPDPPATPTPPTPATEEAR